MPSSMVLSFVDPDKIGERRGIRSNRSIRILQLTRIPPFEGFRESWNKIVLKKTIAKSCRMQKLVKIDLVGNFYIFHCVMKYKINFTAKTSRKI